MGKESTESLHNVVRNACSSVSERFDRLRAHLDTQFALQSDCNGLPDVQGSINTATSDILHVLQELCDVFPNDCEAELKLPEPTEATVSDWLRNSAALRQRIAELHWKVTNRDDVITALEARHRRREDMFDHIRKQLQSEIIQMRAAVGVTADPKSVFSTLDLLLVLGDSATDDELALKVQELLSVLQSERSQRALEDGSVMASVQRVAELTRERQALTSQMKHMSQRFQEEQTKTKLASLAGDRQNAQLLAELERRSQRMAETRAALEREKDRCVTVEAQRDAAELQLIQASQKQHSETERLYVSIASLSLRLHAATEGRQDRTWTLDPNRADVELAQEIASSGRVPHAEKNVLERMTNLALPGDDPRVVASNDALLQKVEFLQQELDVWRDEAVTAASERDNYHRQHTAALEELRRLKQSMAEHGYAVPGSDEGIEVMRSNTVSSRMEAPRDSEDAAAQRQLSTFRTEVAEAARRLQHTSDLSKIAVKRVRSHAAVLSVDGVEVEPLTRSGQEGDGEDVLEDDDDVAPTTLTAISTRLAGRMTQLRDVTGILVAEVRKLRDDAKINAAAIDRERAEWEAYWEEVLTQLPPQVTAQLRVSGAQSLSTAPVREAFLTAIRQAQEELRQDLQSRRLEIESETDGKLATLAREMQEKSDHAAAEAEQRIESLSRELALAMKGKRLTNDTLPSKPEKPPKPDPKRKPRRSTALLAPVRDWGVQCDLVSRGSLIVEQADNEVRSCAPAAVPTGSWDAFVQTDPPEPTPSHNKFCQTAPEAYVARPARGSASRVTSAAHRRHSSCQTVAGDPPSTTQKVPTPKASGEVATCTEVEVKDMTFLSQGVGVNIERHAPLDEPEEVKLSVSNEHSNAPVDRDVPPTSLCGSERDSHGMQAAPATTTTAAGTPAGSPTHSRDKPPRSVAARKTAAFPTQTFIATRAVGLQVGGDLDTCEVAGISLEPVSDLTACYSQTSMTTDTPKAAASTSTTPKPRSATQPMGDLPLPVSPTVSASSRVQTGAETQDAHLTPRKSVPGSRSTQDRLPQLSLKDPKQGLLRQSPQATPAEASLTEFATPRRHLPSCKPSPRSPQTVSPRHMTGGPTADVPERALSNTSKAVTPLLGEHAVEGTITRHEATFAGSEQSGTSHQDPVTPPKQSLPPQGSTVGAHTPAASVSEGAPSPPREDLSFSLVAPIPAPAAPTLTTEEIRELVAQLRSPSPPRQVRHSDRSLRDRIPLRSICPHCGESAPAMPRADVPAPPSAPFHAVPVDVPPVAAETDVAEVRPEAPPRSCSASVTTQAKPKKSPLHARPVSCVKVDARRHAHADEALRQRVSELERLLIAATEKLAMLAAKSDADEQRVPVDVHVATTSTLRQGPSVLPPLPGRGATPSGRQAVPTNAVLVPDVVFQRSGTRSRAQRSRIARAHPGTPMSAKEELMNRSLSPPFPMFHRSLAADCQKLARALPSLAVTPEPKASSKPL